MEKTIDERVKAEYKRLVRILKKAEISKNKLIALDSIINNVSWMKVKLDDARNAIKDADICINYDNGGGQKGVRENPLFKGYEALWKSYLLGVDKIINALPEESTSVVIQEVKPTANILAEIRSRHNERKSGA